jgi:hypothetical protein
MKRLLTVDIGLFILMTLVIAGCAAKSVAPPTQATLQTRTLKPSSGKALVYYYNHKRFLGSTSVSLDKMSSHIGKDAYVVWEVDPGAYHLEFYYKGILPEKVGLDITCEADHIYYFHMLGHERATHNIAQADDQTGRANIEKFALSGWFKDGSLVAITEPAPKVETPVAEAERKTSQPESTPETHKPTSESEQRVTVQTHYYAFVIGIEGYQHWDKLPTAVNDARAVTKVLQESYGFQGQTLLDQQATREGILEALNALSNTLKMDDKLLIYYAGHCFLKPDTQMAYWLPVDARRDSDTQWISAETITAILNQIPANQILIVADSCYSGILARTPQRNVSSETQRQRYLDEIADTRSRILITSGGNNPTGDRKDEKLSLFARIFIDALTNIDQQRFTAEELFARYIQESVAGASEQIPEFGIIRNSGHQGGDFIFQKQAAP